MIGLTGPTGAGKTTVSDEFAKQGFFVINCDKIARHITDTSQKCVDELVHEFSKVILNEDKTINRQKLADIVFGDNVKKACLEGVIYPYITAQILDNITQAANDGYEYVLLDAPTLFESNADDFCDIVICVCAPESTRLDNIIKRDSLSQRQAQARINAQNKTEFYIQRSDIVINNTDSLDILRAKANEVAKRVKEYCDGKN